MKCLTALLGYLNVLSIFCSSAHSKKNNYSDLSPLNALGGSPSPLLPMDNSNVLISCNMELLLTLWFTAECHTKTFIVL